MEIRNIILIAFGGALGSVLRYIFSVLISRYSTTSFPLGTFLINVAGCFFIGVAAGLLTSHQMADSSLKYFLIAGFCGGFTTFSAFGNENLLLLQQGNISTALLYILSSVILGIAAVWLGLYVSR